MRQELEGKGLREESIYLFRFHLLILERREGGRERNIDLLFHLLIDSLVASCTCPDWDGICNLSKSG